ncbi:MAG: DUF5916 domain-containing protein [bacterium]
MHSYKNIILVAIFCLFCQFAYGQSERPKLRALFIGKAEQRKPTSTPTESHANLNLPGGLFANSNRIPFNGSSANNNRPFIIEKNDLSQRAPQIDGILNEAVWHRADIATAFTQREPNEGVITTEKTEVRVLYDENHLYLGFRCYDREPEKIVATEMRNDARLENDDHIRVVVDTYLDRRNGFVFETNPLGARSDAKITDEGRNVNDDWDIVWEVNAKITDTGWEAEMRIPLNQLRYPKSQITGKWGINFSRVIRRKREDTYWAPIRLDYGFGSRAFYKVSKAGDLEGLEFMPHKARLEIKPYNLSGLQRDESVSPIEREGIFDGGFDLKYALTENLITDVTVNTDFAQVEADQERVNLTRFSLFFPEKREFFLEGAGIFRIGAASGPGSGNRGGGDQLFYSRRIGLTGGNEVPIIAGSKITGNFAGLEIGLLDVVTDEFDEIDDGDTTSVPRTNYGALRMTKPILSNSSVGLLVLSKDALNENKYEPDYDDYNRTFAVDGNFAFGPSTTLNAWLARTVTPGNPGKEWAGNFNFRYRTDKWVVRSGYSNIQDNFNAEMGFLRRVGIRKSNLELGRGIRPKRGHWMQRIYNAPSISYLTDSNNKLLTREVGFRTFLQFRDGHVYFGSPKQVYDQLEDDWEIYSKDEKVIVIPAGIYTYYTYNFFFRTDASKPLSARIGGDLGEFFNGNRYGGNANFTYKPSAHVSWNFSYNLNRVELPAGNFTTNVISTRFIYTLSRDMFAKAFVQWNDTREILSFNLLYNFYYRPGSDIYLVYNHVWETGGAHLQTDNRSLLLKLSYWLNL